MIVFFHFISKIWQNFLSCVKVKLINNNSFAGFVFWLQVSKLRRIIRSAFIHSVCLCLLLCWDSAAELLTLLLHSSENSVKSLKYENCCNYFIMLLLPQISAKICDKNSPVWLQVQNSPVNLNRRSCLNFAAAFRKFRKKSVESSKFAERLLKTISSIIFQICSFITHKQDWLFEHWDPWTMSEMVIYRAAFWSF